MGLTLGEMLCINCRKYRFEVEEFIGLETQETAKRGEFSIEKTCPLCGTDNELVVFNSRKHGAFALAYSCTNNDEPCYEPDCEKCVGSDPAWWQGDR